MVLSLSLVLSFTALSGVEALDGAAVCGWVGGVPCANATVASNGIASVKICTLMEISW